MKKTLAYILIFIFLCSLGNYSIDYVLGKQITEQSPYYLSFASIGAIYLESRLDCWAKIKTSSSSQELQDYLDDILESLQIVLKPENVNIVENSTDIILRYESNNPGLSLLVTINSDNKNNESYFLLSIISRNKATKLENYETCLNKIIGLKWKCYYLYQGEIPYFIAEQSKIDLANVILKNMQAKQIESFQGNGILSISAYSEKLNKKVPALTVCGKKYNLQVTMTNDSRSGRTQVYIGTPLILGEY